MRQLFILNCALLALASVMALVLGVVCLIYAVYLDEMPKLRSEFPFLIISALLFMGVASAMAFATWTLRQALRVGRFNLLAGVGQAIALVSIGGMVLFFAPNDWSSGLLQLLVSAAA